jgi:hypothetical protein
MTLAPTAEPRYLSDRDVDRRYQAPTASSATSNVTELRAWRLRRDRETVVQQVEQLRALAPGWDGEQGKVPALVSLDYAYRVVLDLLAQSVMRPSIVPVSDGGVTIEWHQGMRQLVLYVPPRDEPVLANYLDAASGEEWEGVLPADARLVEDQLGAFRAV